MTASSAQSAAPPRVVVHPVPEGVPTREAFAIRVRVPGGVWQPVPAYQVLLSDPDPVSGTHRQRPSSVASFGVEGPVEVEVSAAAGPVRSARVRPLSLGIEPEVRGAAVRFLLPRPRDLVVQVDGETFDCVHLLVNPAGSNLPDRDDRDDPRVIRFGPGVHSVPGGELRVESGQTVHLEGGAVLRSRVVFRDVENAALVGHGVIAGAPGGGCLVERSRRIRIEGVTMIDPDGYAVLVGESAHVTISRLRAFSAKKWGDGIDVFCSTDVRIDRVFLRTSDDCVALYTHRWDYHGDTRDVALTDSVLWADVAHPVNIGTHGSTDAPEVLEGLLLFGLDILDHREPQLDYQGCIALNAGDSNLIRDVRIEDVRVEDFRQGQLFNMRVMFRPKYNTSVGRGIESVYVKDVTYTGTHAAPAVLAGYDAEHAVRDVTFENLVVNGTVIADSMPKPTWFATADMVPMHVNEHVTGLRFLTSAEAAEAAAPGTA